MAKLPNNPNQIIVNYHYVQNPDPAWSGIFPCSVAEFDRQIRFLSENYKIVSVPEVYEEARKGGAAKLCAITFDDGLRSQLDNALPILQKYGATGTFFIITSSFEGRLPTAYKNHALLSRASVEELINLLDEFLAGAHPDLREHYRIPTDRRLTQRRLHENPAVANFKETLITMPEDLKDQFLQYAFAKFRLDEKKICQQIFLSREQVRKLSELGMTVGNHSHLHYTYDTISPETMTADLRQSQEILDRFLGHKPTIFSYPHGRHGAAAIEVLKKEGFDHAVTIERQPVGAGTNPLTIPRFDAADLYNHEQ